MPVYNPGPGFTNTSGYGPRDTGIPDASIFHRGEDFAAPSGTSIPAAADGVVYYSKMAPGYGNVVVIEHNVDGEKVYTLYAHMNQLSPLKEGDPVAQGDSVGNVGNTGIGKGFHLHFEIIKDQPNPLKKGHDTYNPNDFDFPETGGGTGSGTGGGAGVSGVGNPITPSGWTGLLLPRGGSDGTGGGAVDSGGSGTTGTGGGTASSTVGGTSAGGTGVGGTGVGGTGAGGTSAGGTSAGGTSAGGTSAGGTSAAEQVPAAQVAATQVAATQVTRWWVSMAQLSRVDNVSVLRLRGL